MKLNEIMNLDEMPRMINEPGLKSEAEWNSWLKSYDYAKHKDKILLKTPDVVVFDSGHRMYLLALIENDEPVYIAELFHTNVVSSIKSGSFLYQSLATKKPGSKLNIELLFDSLLRFAELQGYTGLCSDEQMTQGGKALWIKFFNYAKAKGLPVAINKNGVTELINKINGSNRFFHSEVTAIDDSRFLVYLDKSVLTTISETASSGGTSAGSVATVVGGLGAGFDPNGDQGIYQKKRKKNAKSTLIIRR